jgi:hypothetical protein
MEGHVTDVRIPQGSKEYVSATVTADVTLSAQTVEVAIRAGTQAAFVWLPAQWVGTSGTIRQCRTTSPVDFTAYPKTAHEVYVRVTDSPEIPVLHAGTLTVIS